MSACILWTGPVNEHGYGRPDRVYAHRSAYEKAYGPIPVGMCILHKCDVRRCINPEHLFIGTRSDNLKDMWAKGRGKNNPRQGERHGMARLTEEKVRAIREEKGPSHAIAPKYGVSPRTIRAVRKRKIWAHVI